MGQKFPHIVIHHSRINRFNRQAQINRREIDFIAQIIMFRLPVMRSSADFNLHEVLLNQHIFLKTGQCLISLALQGLIGSAR